MCVIIGHKRPLHYLLTPLHLFPHSLSSLYLNLIIGDFEQRSEYSEFCSPFAFQRSPSPSPSSQSLFSCHTRRIASPNPKPLIAHTSVPSSTPSSHAHSPPPTRSPLLPGVAKPSAFSLPPLSCQVAARGEFRH